MKNNKPRVKAMLAKALVKGWLPWAATLVAMMALLAGVPPVTAQSSPPLSAEQSAELEEAQRLNEQVIQLYNQGPYAAAIPLAERALAIREKVLGKEHPDVATSLNNLAGLYRGMGNYSQAEPLLQRALAIKEKVLGLEHPDVANSLNNLAELYREMGNYSTTEPLLQRALAIKEKVLGLEHPSVATSLNNLAGLYREMGNYSAAEPLYQRSLAIREKVLGLEHPSVANSLNNLANLYHDMGNYSTTEPLYQRALAIREKVLGLEHPDVATSLNNLALLYSDMGNYSTAEPLYQRALAIREKVLGLEHPSVANSLNNLAALYQEMGNYSAAEPLFQRALAIREKVLGLEHPSVATSLNNLAALYSDMGNYSTAEPLYQRALAILEKLLGLEHPSVATSLNNLAGLYQDMGNYSTAEPLYQRALAILEKLLGLEHPSVATSLNNLAGLYQDMGNYSTAEPLYQRALAILEKLLGLEHPSVATSLNNLALLYSDMGNYSMAEPLYQRALAILEKVLGLEHPDVATSLNNLAGLYQDMGNYSTAEPLYQRALAIREKVLGLEHPSVATSLNNLANLYQAMGNYSTTKPLYQRSLAIREKVLGKEHPDVAQSLNNLAALYHDMENYSTAEPLYQRALAIREKVLGQEHPSVATSLNNLAALYRAQGNVDEAMEFLTRSTSIQEKNLALIFTTGSERRKRNYMATISGTTNATASLHLQDAPNNPEAARLALTTVLQRKGRVLDALTDSLQILRQNLNPEDQVLLDELAATRSQLAALLFNGVGDTPPQEYQQQVAALKAKAEAQENRLARRSAEFRTESQPVTLEAVQSLIPADAALVELVLYKPYNAKATKPDERWGVPHYAAYVLPDQGAPKWVDLGEAEPINQAVSKFRKALQSQASDIKPVARTLDELLMQPVRQKLGNTRQVLLSPDSQLNLIPFAALVDENNQYLVENYSITYLGSGRDILRLENSSPSRSAPVVVANPDFDNPGNPAVQIASNLKTSPPAPPLAGEGREVLPFPAREGGLGGLGQAALNRGTNNKRSGDIAQMRFEPLPGTAQEAQVITPLLPGVTLLTKSDATENAIKQVNAPSILHIATHGFFLEDVELVAPPAYGESNTFSLGRSLAAVERRPGTTATPRNYENPLLRSGIALAGFNPRQSGTEDGVLTALEAAGLNLRGTKLVVLSACETGLGDVANGEGIYGLRRAFATAGAESQLLSVWKVDDYGTKDLMVKYYQRLMNQEGRSEALRQVQLEMLANPQYQHPFFWGAFIPSGDWGAMELQ
jgi:tetratricopeptide (TPR) repeat protein